MVTIAAPSDPMHVSGLLSPAALAEIDRIGEADVHLAGRQFRIRRQFLEDISSQSLTVAVARLDAALLVLHSPVDQLVPVDHARRIYEAARHPKSFVSLDDADHLLTNRADAAYVARLLAAWVSRYLPESDHMPGAPPPEGHVVVEETGTGAFSQQVYAGRHSFPADEPLGIGDDTGPSPYDLVLAGLGACTSMTLRMYARRRELPLDHVRVTLSHRRHHAEDCSDPDGTPAPSRSSTARSSSAATSPTNSGPSSPRSPTSVRSIAHSKARSGSTPSSDRRADRPRRSGEIPCWSGHGIRRCPGGLPRTTVGATDSRRHRRTRAGPSRGGPGKPGVSSTGLRNRLPSAHSLTGPGVTRSDGGRR